jgi:Sec-independent protein translocase protein TatA
MRLGEFVVTIGVLAVTLGTKDLPILARGLGRLTGRALGAT